MNNLEEILKLINSSKLSEREKELIKAFVHTSYLAGKEDGKKEAMEVFEKMQKELEKEIVTP